MAARTGDIYSVEIGPDQFRLFHHVVNDSSELNANVVRVFKPTYTAQALLDPSPALLAEIDFHALTICSNGIRLGLWRKVGHQKPVGQLDIWFRKSGDYGKPEVAASRDWYVWKVNQPKVRVGVLPPEHHCTALGPIWAPAGLVQRIRTGNSGYFYPSYE
jgi:hypothetical protein